MLQKCNGQKKIFITQRKRNTHNTPIIHIHSVHNKFSKLINKKKKKTNN